MNVFYPIVVLLAVFALHANASVEVYEFDTDQERQRYMQFLDELRCPKCKNNNLAGTNSKIAVDLRRQLKTMIKDGQEDKEIIDYMVTRYGDFVLYRPRLNNKTAALWFGPMVLFGVGAVLVGLIVLRRRKTLNVTPDGLSDDESQALKRILESSADDTKSAKK